VIVMSYLNTPWYAKQIRDLTTPCPAGRSAEDDPTRIICQRQYQSEDGPAFYAAIAQAGDSAGVSAQPQEGGPPMRSILPLTDEQIRQVTETPPFRTAEA